MYAPFGVVERPGAEFLPPADKGRFMVTKTPSDEYVFKVPTVRNIALTAPLSFPKIISAHSDGVVRTILAWP
jgi:hypothetical protein